MKFNQLVYKPGKELIGYQIEDILYTTNGIAYGKVVNNVVYTKYGQYIGEFNPFGYLISMERSRTIDTFELPENKEPLSKKHLLFGATRHATGLSTPYHNGGAKEFQEYPCTEDLEQMCFIQEFE